MQFLDDICEVQTRKFNRFDVRFAKAFIEGVIRAEKKRKSSSNLVRVEVKVYRERFKADEELTEEERKRRISHLTRKVS
jgi:hypothetical protein